ncbi:MAG: carboxylating nicotinate-nucleotide diphosphorylase [Candidatus Omnitrophica bacterium]|nr:carboxylating nicotinate-nucleotide diphosphorylase [Candidatus Omnitrophota bacterium]
MLLSKENKLLIDKTLEEDCAFHDLTSGIVIANNTSAKAFIHSKENCILCGVEAARYIFNRLDKKATFKLFKNDSQNIKKGDRILEINSNTRSILSAERTALNFLSFLSGVATKTSKFVQKIKDLPAKIYDTRKTFPLLRSFQKYAVKTGGGFNHRFSLNHAILIKENHLKGSKLLIKGKPDLKAIEKVFDSIRKKNKGPIEIEVESLQEFRKIIEIHPDIILLDNFNLSQLKTAVQFRNKHYPKIILEASGGISLSNIRKVALTGVERISVGDITHTVDSIDLSLDLL